MNNDDFTRVRRLGAGSEGTTWLEQNVRTKEYSACKERPLRVFYVLKGHEEREDMPKEVWIRKWCMPWKHRNLLDLHKWRIIESPETPEFRRCHLWYEYCEGGNLRSLMPRGHPGQHPEAFIWHVFIQLAEALDAMHNLGDKRVIHRDLNPQNVLLKSRYRPNHSFPTVKLGDYGSAMTEDEVKGKITVTMEYMPPELKTSAKGDVWALGAVIHELCHGFDPVSRKHSDWAHDPAARKPKKLPQPYTDALDSQVMACLTVDPEERPGIEDMVRNLLEKRPSEHF